MAIPVEPQVVSTPGLTTVPDVARALGVPEAGLLKAYPVVLTSASAEKAAGELTLVLVRGDHRVNEIKLALALGAHSRPAHAEEIERTLGPPGFIGPVGLAGDIEILLDRAVVALDARSGAPGGGTDMTPPSVSLSSTCESKPHFPHRRFEARRR